MRDWRGPIATLAAFLFAFFLEDQETGNILAFGVKSGPLLVIRKKTATRNVCDVSFGMFPSFMFVCLFVC